MSSESIYRAGVGAMNGDTEEGAGGVEKCEKKMERAILRFDVAGKSDSGRFTRKVVEIVG
jgi:hypothetical protein